MRVGILSASTEDGHSTTREFSRAGRECPKEVTDGDEGDEPKETNEDKGVRPSQKVHPPGDQGATIRLEPRP